MSAGRLANKGVTSLFESDSVVLRNKHQSIVVGYRTHCAKTKIFALSDPTTTVMYTLSSL